MAAHPYKWENNIWWLLQGVYDNIKVSPALLHQLRQHRKRVKAKKEKDDNSNRS